MVTARFQKYDDPDGQGWKIYEPLNVEAMEMLAFYAGIPSGLPWARDIAEGACRVFSFAKLGQPSLENFIVRIHRQKVTPRMASELVGKSWHATEYGVLSALRFPDSDGQGAMAPASDDMTARAKRFCRVLDAAPRRR